MAAVFVLFFIFAFPMLFLLAFLIVVARKTIQGYKPNGGEPRTDMKFCYDCGAIIYRQTAVYCPECHAKIIHTQGILGDANR